MCINKVKKVAQLIGAAPSAYIKPNNVSSAGAAREETQMPRFDRIMTLAAAGVLAGRSVSRYETATMKYYFIIGRLAPRRCMGGLTSTHILISARCYVDEDERRAKPLLPSARIAQMISIIAFPCQI
jgi:hypothetical protein